MARGVRIQLRAGVGGSATLPNGRQLVSGTPQTITLEEFSRIPLTARQKVIEVVAFETTPTQSREGVPLNLNSATLPTGRRVGQVIEGIGPDDQFKLVRATVALAAGDVAGWADRDAGTVNKESKEFAGVAVSTIDANNYGWIQIDGQTPLVKVAAETAVEAGDLLATSGSGTAVVASANTPSAELVGTAVDEIVEPEGEDPWPAAQTGVLLRASSQSGLMKPQFGSRYGRK